MTKKIICMLLCLATVFSLTACGLLGGKDNTDTTEPAVATTPDGGENNPTEEGKPVEDNNNDYREGSVEDVAQTFVNSLIKADYETALKCFNVPSETPYFTVADIEWYLPRSSYADVADITYEYDVTVNKIDSEAETATCEVIVRAKDSDKSKTFTLNMALDKTNKWGVKDNEFYLDEYYVVAPGGDAVLTVNGVDASENYDSKFGTSQNQHLYKLTFVGKSEKTLAVSHKNFETDEEKVYPVTNTAEEPLKLVVEYDDEAALTAMKEIWMEFYQAAVDGKAYSEMVHLLSPSANAEMAKGIMDGLTDIIDEGNCHDFAITKMTYAAQKDGQHTKWLASDKLQISFNYSLSWIVDGFGGGNEDMNYYDIVILHFDGEKFTLDTNVENHIFTQRDAWNDKSI